MLGFQDEMFHVTIFSASLDIGQWNYYWRHGSDVGTSGWKFGHWNFHQDGKLEPCLQDKKVQTHSFMLTWTCQQQQSAIFCFWCFFSLSFSKCFYKSCSWGPNTIQRTIFRTFTRIICHFGLQVTGFYNYIFLLSNHISKGHKVIFCGIFLLFLSFYPYCGKTRAP